MKSILTTVVGSYPVPLWLRQGRTGEGLRDATLAVLKTQENAGIDLITDGELSRFDADHPDTNGMIDIKDHRIETPDEIARAIERAARAVDGVHRIRYVHPDCGLWMLPRSVVDRKLTALVQGRDLFLDGRGR